MNRLDLYLQQSVGSHYENTERENELVNKFETLYRLTRSAIEQRVECNPERLDMLRRAYEGTLGALTVDGTESKRKGRQLRKVAYEIVESLIDNTIPTPKMKPRYKTDIPVVSITEDYLRFEVDKILTKFENDRSERSVYIDGTGWYKVWWDSLDNTHERSGDVKIEFMRNDQVYPQPGVKDYRQLEYIFCREKMSISRIYDVYRRKILPIDNSTNVIEVVSCYYLNDDRVVGLFMWDEASRTVICNEESWQIRKIRKCMRCKTIAPQATECPACGGKSFSYYDADEEILSEPIEQIVNPYDLGETSDDEQRDKYEKRVFAQAGEKIPVYVIRQLPFVPRPAVSCTDSLYGMSVVKVILESQDMINKVLTKAVDKTLKSGAVVTKPEKIKLGDYDESFKVIGVRTTEESNMIQVKQIEADTTQDLTIASVMYDNSKASSGVTDAFQGKRDTTAVSGKAKAYSVMQSEGRLESMRVMKSTSFAGIYELIFKYLLAFSDESRRFVKVLPDGSKIEQCWSKYMFIDRDKYGQLYYRDDFNFDTDTRGALANSRENMWQETTNKFVQGAFGDPSDPRTLKAYWNMMDALQYPLSNTALAAIEESERHLPAQIEQAIMSDPELMQIVQTRLADTAKGGNKPNGATHAANVERTNERNRANAGNTLPAEVAGLGV